MTMMTMAFINLTYGLKLLYNKNTTKNTIRFVIQMVFMCMALLAYVFRRQLMGLHPSTILFVLFMMYRT